MTYAFQKGVVHATTPTSLSTVSYTVSGLGTPAGVLIIATRASALGTQTAGWSQSWGVSDGTRQRVCYSASKDAVATGVSKGAGHNASLIRIIDPSTNAVVVEGVFSAWVTDGVSVQYTTVDSTAWEITVLLLGGTQCQCYVNDMTPPATTGATTVTTSFLPDFVLTNVAHSQNGTQANIADYSPGVATRNGGSPQNMVVQIVCDRGTTSSSRTRTSNVDVGASISLLTPGDTLTDAAVISNFTATGFDVSNSAAGAAGQGPNLSFMAVKVTGAQPIGVALHEDFMPTSTGNVSYTFPGFRTGTLITLFSNNTVSNQDTGNGTGGVSLSDVLSNTGSSTVTGLTNTAPSKTRSNHSHGFLDFWNANDSVHVAVATVASQDATGHTLNFTTAPTSGRTMYQLAIQEAPLDATGSSTGATSVSGTLLGAGALVGSSAGATVVAGTIKGAGALTGSSAGATVASGTLLGAGSLTGSSTGATSVAGTIKGAGSLTGSSTGATAASGALLGAAALTGSAAGATAASGTLLGAGALTGTASGTTAVSGALTATGALTGSSAGATSASGTLLGDAALTGTAAGATAASGTLIAASAISGTSAGATSVSGTLLGAGALVGSSAGATTVSGTIVTQNQLVGNAAGATAASGTLLGAAALSGSSSGSTTVAGLLRGLAPLTGSAAGSTSAAGLLTGIASLTGTAAGATSVAALLRGAGALVGSAHGATNVQANASVPSPACVLEFEAGANEVTNLSAGSSLGVDLQAGYNAVAEMEGTVC